MGLMIYSLDNIPKTANRDFFIYLLDYGWDEPISNALRNNFDRMAQIAAKNKAVIIKGTEAAHFQNEVFSWHSFNNQDASELLPALLITNNHPQYFRESEKSLIKGTKLTRFDDDLKLILIPFKRFCETTSQSISLIEQVFNDIESQKDLSNFRVAKEMNKGVGSAIVDSLILEPNISGIGFNFNKLKDYLK